MSKEMKSEELDKLLEETWIKEAESIEQCLLGADTKLSMSPEELETSYKSFEERLKSERLCETEVNTGKGAEIVHFPSGVNDMKMDNSQMESAQIENARTGDEPTETMDQAAFMDDLVKVVGLSETKRRNSWNGLGKAAGFFLLFAISILAGSAANSADRKNFVEVVEFIVDNGGI